MQAAPARYVSVSELYSTDEVELLLDEIRELEPTSCRGEDLQDFEIAGSGCGGAGGGGRSPAGTELTERSWDSHAQYRRVPLPHPRPLAPLYCRLRHLLTLQGAASALLVLCCTSSCACVWAGVGRGVARMPMAARLQLLLLAALSSALLHAALLVMHITRLTALLPLDWNKLIVCVVSSVLLLTNGTCRNAPSLIPSAAFVALSCGVIIVVFYGVIVLGLSLYLPQVCLLSDIIVSTVMGVVLFVIAVLTMTVCKMTDSFSYVHGPLGIVNAGMLLGSAVTTYVSVMRRWDALHAPYEPSRPIPTEQDV